MPAASDAFLGPLLRTIAQSLDVRDIFARISEEARRIVPHDFLYFGRLLDEQRQRIRLIALSGTLPAGLGELEVPPGMRPTFDVDAIVLNEMQSRGDDKVAGTLRTNSESVGRPVEMSKEPLYHELVVVRDFHTFMRVTVRLRGGVIGGLVFCSHKPDAYTPADVEKARAIADCVALALAHQQLAEEQQRTIEARERAAGLEARVQRLTEELADTTRRRTIGQSKVW